MELPYISLPNEIPNIEYHTGERYAKFISSSELKQMLISPKWFRFSQDNPEYTSNISLENATKGSVYHDLLQSIVNTGDTVSFFNAWAVFEPPINLKTGKPYGYDSQAFTGAYAEFQMLNPGKEICSQSEIDLAEKMIKELRFGNKHLSADINFMIKHGHAERSHFVEYQGAFFKFRTDLETPSKIVDWKTCQFEVPKPENWSKQVVKMGYDISAAFYQFFCFISTGIWKPFYWVAQEKEPPFDFNIIDASNWAYEVNLKTQEVIPHTGALKFRKLLDAYMECYHKDDWPGYSVFTLPQIYQGKEKRIATAPVPGYESNKSIFFYL